MTREWVCRLQLLLAISIAVILRFNSRWNHDHILLSQIRDSPNLEGQVPAFICPRNRVAQLYPQELGYLSFVSYDSQDYVGGIRPRLHTGLTNWTELGRSSDIVSERTTQKTQLLTVLSLLRAGRCLAKFQWYCVFTNLLPRSCHRIIVCFAVVV
jgi:hypothetical protein